jgi:hypothetical protein
MIAFAIGKTFAPAVISVRSGYPVEEAVSCKEGKMFIHIFGFRWEPAASAADQARAEKEILAFRGVIPGLLEAFVGQNLSPRGQGYTFAGMMKFTDKTACDAYSVHPAHMALLEWLVPLIDPVELDFEAQYP